MKLTLVLGAACLTLAAAPALAQDTVVVEQKPSGSGVAAGAATGAVAGAVVAGPVAPVTYSGDVVVGKPIAGEVVWMEVPRYPKYRWAYLNGQRVVVDANTHSVVAVY